MPRHALHGDPLIDERLDLIRALVAGLEMLEKGRAERDALRDLLARLDHAIAAAEANVREMGERLVQLDVQASPQGSSQAAGDPRAQVPRRNPSATR